MARDIPTSFQRDLQNHVPKAERVTSQAYDEDHVPISQFVSNAYRRRSSDLFDFDFEFRLLSASYDHLIAKEGKPNKPNARSIYLSTLQRMFIHNLQRELVILDSRLRNDQRADNLEMKRAQTLLEDYCQCTQVLWYITKRLVSHFDATLRAE